MTEETRTVDMEFNSIVPHSSVEVNLNLTEMGKAKERFCRREAHLNADSLKVGNSWISLCPNCKEEINKHIASVLARHNGKFEAIKK